MIRQKGLYIKQSYPNTFVNFLTDMYDKYGESIFSIQGIANKHMDVVEFSKSFFNNSSDVADISIDGNANVKEKNIMQYNHEFGKALQKLNSIYLVHKWLIEIYDEETANRATEKVINGELFINDLTRYAMSYCFAFDLRKLLYEGMSFFKSNMNIGPPKRSDSFIALLIQSTAYISNQIMGASSYPDFFVILDHFYRRELGKDYIRKAKDRQSEEWHKIKNQFQNFIYSMNFPFRGSQSSFTNLSVMDKGFARQLFKDYKIPTPEGDFVDPDLDSMIELSKLFFEYYSEINSEEGIFTFPVMTLAISLDEDNNYIDEDFVEWSSIANSEKALANIFQSRPNSFSSCCRLKNDLDKANSNGFHNSFGVGGLSVGSHRVAGLNLPRIAHLEKDNPDILQEDIDLLHKILYSHRQLIKHITATGNFPLYDTEWIHLSKQYSTIGFIGAYEYVCNKGLDISSDEGIKCITDILEKIESNIVKWQNDEKEEKNIYNIEQIPGESMAVRLAEIDYELGYNKDKDEIRHKLYSNQYIPLVKEASIYERLRIQGKIDSLTSGGAIAHINIDDEKPLDSKIFKRIIVTAKDLKVPYFAINYAYSECAKGHFSVGKKDSCPVCSSNIVCQYTRVVGFITPVRSWNTVRKNYEYNNRTFYTNKGAEL